jgi:hypothetical protein
LQRSLNGRENSQQGADDVPRRERGSIAGLEFLDQSGATMTVEFPLDQAQAVI